MTATIEQLPEVTNTPKNNWISKSPRAFGSKSQPCTPVTKAPKDIKNGGKGGFMKMSCKVPESNILRPSPVKVHQKWSFDDLTKMIDLVKILDKDEEPAKKIAATRMTCV